MSQSAARALLHETHGRYSNANFGTIRGPHFMSSLAAVGSKTALLTPYDHNTIYTVSHRPVCHYIFNGNLDKICPIAIIFDTGIHYSDYRSILCHPTVVSFLHT